jgi:hypothetical protein
MTIERRRCGNLWAKTKKEKEAKRKKRSEGGGLWKLTPLMEIRKKTRIPTAA